MNCTRSLTAVSMTKKIRNHKLKILILKLKSHKRNRHEVLFSMVGLCAPDDGPFKKQKKKKKSI